MTTNRDARTDALVNGVLIALGASAVADNILTHWVLSIHRVISGPWTLTVEWIVMVIGAIVLAIGLWRERAARNRPTER